MVRVEMYFRESEEKDALGELRVSITNRWGQVMADMNYDGFLKKKGHNEIRLHNLIKLTDKA